MKNKIFIIIFFPLLFITACEDQLDLLPPDKISDATYWKDAEDFRMAANYLYNSLPFREYELDADLMRGESVNSISAGTNLPVENDAYWNSRWESLRSINYLIEKAEMNSTIDADRYKAEARFFRALNYYLLVSRYGDVPLITKALDNESDELNSPRESRDIVIDFCIQDLQLAIPDLPLRSEMDASDLGRITKGAAQTLLAKIALFEATWTKYNGGPGASKVSDWLQIAINASDAVINSDEYALYDLHGDDSYRQLFWNEDADDVNPGVKSEKVLSIIYIENIKMNSASISARDILSATKKAVDMYLCTDGLPIDKSPLFNGYGTYTSEFENRDHRLIQSVAQEGDIIYDNHGARTLNPEVNYFITNYTGYKIKKFLADGAERHLYNVEYNDIEVFRYPEVLLIYAEAKYENDGSISDADLDRTINVLRTRGNIAPLTNVLVNENGLDMLTEIRRERTVELMFEGERLEDLKRWGIAVQEMSQSFRGIQWDNSDWKDAGFGIETLTAHGTDAEGFIVKDPASDRYFSEKHILFPLPLQELQITGWENNPGW